MAKMDHVLLQLIAPPTTTVMQVCAQGLNLLENPAYLNMSAGERHSATSMRPLIQWKELAPLTSVFQMEIHLRSFILHLEPVMLIIYCRHISSR